MFEYKPSSVVTEAIIKEGWTIPGTYKEGDMFYSEIEAHSPAGEDVVETVWFDGTDESFSRALRGLWLDYDPDEHAAEMIGMRGTHGVPSSTRILVEDAFAIMEMLHTLSDAVAEAVRKAKK